MNNSELYAVVEDVSQELNAAGEEHWSIALEDALSISTVPGEILGETRLQLQKLKASEVPTLLSLNDRVDEALAYLDRIL